MREGGNKWKFSTIWDTIVCYCISLILCFLATVSPKTILEFYYRNLFQVRPRVSIKNESFFIVLTFPWKMIYENRFNKPRTKHIQTDVIFRYKILRARLTHQIFHINRISDFFAINFVLISRTVGRTSLRHDNRFSIRNVFSRISCSVMGRTSEAGIFGG